MPVDKDLSFTVVESREEVDESSFAGARRTDKRVSFALVDREIDVLQHIDGRAVLVGGIGERDVAILNRMLKARKDVSIGEFDDLLVGIENLKETIGAGVTLLEVVVGAHDRLDGRDETREDDDKENEDRRKHLAVEDQHAAKNEDCHETYCAKDFGERGAEFAASSHANHGAGVVVVGMLKALLTVLLTSEESYGGEIVERLVEDREKIAEFFLTALGVTLQTLSDFSDEKYRERKNQQKIEKQLGADEDKRKSKEKNIDRVFGGGEHRGDDAPLHIGEIVRDAAEDIAAASGVEERDREDGDLMIDIIAEATRDAVADGSDEKHAQIAERIGQQRSQEIAARNRKEAGPDAIGVLESVERVEEPVGEALLRERKDRGFGRGLIHAEEKLDKRNYHHIGEKVEKHVEEIENHHKNQLLRIILEILEYADDGRQY